MEEPVSTNQEHTHASARKVTQDNTARKTSMNVLPVPVLMVVNAKTKLVSTFVNALQVMKEPAVKLTSMNAKMIPVRMVALVSIPPLEVIRVIVLKATKEVTARRLTGNLRVAITKKG